MADRIALRDRAQALLHRHWPVLVLLALALSVRLMGLFPLHYYGDDAEYATVAWSLAADPTNLAYPDIEGWGPHPFVSQPPVLLYLFAATSAVVGSIELGPVLVSVLLGTATVAVVYAIGVELDGRLAGGLAGLFVAVLPTHVSMSRRATLDAGLAFFVALAVLCFVLWARHRTRFWALATGTAAACAAFSKLYGGLVYVPLIAGFAWMLWRAGRRADADDRRRELVGQLGWAALPGALFTGLYLGLLAYLHALENLWAKLAWQFGRVGGSAGDAGASNPWHWYLTDGTYGLPEQVGWLMALAAIVGLALAVWRSWDGRRSGAWLAVGIWPLAILGFFMVSGRKEWFYVIPALPGLAVLAALAFAPAAGAIRERLARACPGDARAGRTIALSGALLVASVPAVGPALATHDEYMTGGLDYGYGVKEAALWIDDRDPEAGQVGTLLGRFTLHFYNGHRTYHAYMPDGEMHRAIEAGEISYVVMDDYLKPFDQNGWMMELVERYDGELVKTYEKDGYSRVKVYELHPGNRTGAT